MIKCVENPEENIKEIEKWIKSITDLHLSKPPPTVHYIKYVYFCHNGLHSQL